MRGIGGDDPFLWCPTHSAGVPIGPTRIPIYSARVPFHPDWHLPHLATSTTERICLLSIVIGAYLLKE